VEVMGRDCGYLAMTSAIAAGAGLALLAEARQPDHATGEQSVETVPAIRAGHRRARRVIVIKAEGVSIPVDRLKTEVDAALRQRSPDAAQSAIETRVTVLGHVVRGGRPSAFDRLLGSRLANVAVRALLANISHKMAAWMPPIELPEEVGTRSPYDPYC